MEGLRGGYVASAVSRDYAVRTGTGTGTGPGAQTSYRACVRPQLFCRRTLLSDGRRKLCAESCELPLHNLLLARQICDQVSTHTLT